MVTTADNLAWKRKAAISWSGGKDSYLAFRRSRNTFDIQALVTMFTDDGSRSRSHGLRPGVIAKHAELLGIPGISGHATWRTYESEFKRVLDGLVANQFTHVVFGDIYLDDHKAWVERVCKECGITAVEPLWGESTTELFKEFLSTGAKARLVLVNSKLLNKQWLGQILHEGMIAQFERLGIDPCGERGEYHTLVVATPEMRFSMELRDISCLQHDGYWLLDTEVAS